MHGLLTTAESNLWSWHHSWRIASAWKMFALNNRSGSTANPACRSRTRNHLHPLCPRHSHVFFCFSWEQSGVSGLAAHGPGPQQFRSSIVCIFWLAHMVTCEHVSGESEQQGWWCLCMGHHVIQWRKNTFPKSSHNRHSIPFHQHASSAVCHLMTPQWFLCTDAWGDVWCPLCQSLISLQSGAHNVLCHWQHWILTLNSWLCSTQGADEAAQSWFIWKVLCVTRVDSLSVCLAPDFMQPWVSWRSLLWRLQCSCIAWKWKTTLISHLVFVKGKWKSLKAAIVSVGGHCLLLLLLLCAPLASSSAGHLTTKVLTSLMVRVKANSNPNKNWRLYTS